MPQYQEKLATLQHECDQSAQKLAEQNLRAEEACVRSTAVEEQKSKLVRELDQLRLEVGAQGI